MPMPDEWGDQQIPDPFETEEMKVKRLKREEDIKETFKQCPRQGLPDFLGGTRKEGR